MLIYNNEILPYFENRRVTNIDVNSQALWKHSVLFWINTGNLENFLYPVEMLFEQGNNVTSMFKAFSCVSFQI